MDVPLEQPREQSTGRTAVWLLLGLLTGYAGLLAWLVLPTLPTPAGGLFWLLLVPAFVATEVFVVYLPIRRGTHTLTLSELPLLCGLVFTDPAGLLVARLVGAAIGLVALDRQRGFRLAFNLGHYAAETATAAVVFHVVLDATNPTEPRGWAAGLLAALAGYLCSSLAVVTVIRLREQVPWRRLLNSVATGSVGVAATGCLGLVVVLVVRTDPRGLLLLGVVAGVLLLAYRGYSGLQAGHGRLASLYGFTDVLCRATQTDEVMRTVLTEVRELLRAETAVAVLRHPDGTLTWWSAPAQPAIPIEEPADAWWQPALAGQTVLLTDPGRRAAERPPDSPAEGVAVPLLSEAGVIGALTVATRLDQVSTFDAADARLLQTLANHASVALQNARHVDKLRQEATEREYEALHDALTGLANRRCFTERVSRALAAGEPLVVVLLDLDGFKVVNDTLGHPVGDELLVEVGARLADRYSSEVVARLGGDEFAVLFTDDAARRAPACAAETVLRALEQPFTVRDVQLTVRASVGVAGAPEHGDTAVTLLRRADFAMYTAKSRGGGVTLYWHDENRDATNRRRLELGVDLRRAILERELVAYYQPLVDVATGRVLRAEALIRWFHPKHGFVPPDEFIPLAEQMGLVGPLTELVLTDALRRCAEWRADGADIGVAVNLSPRGLDHDLPRIVAEALRDNDVPPWALSLEVTESTVMSDVGRGLAVLDELARLGIEVAVDDYGTGYSSLSYLSRLPVSELKIDKSFVLTVTSNPQHAAIVRSTVHLGHELGLRVVAEGVEDAGALELLRAWGCDIAQGYLFSRPVASEQLTVLLRDGVGSLAG